MSLVLTLASRNLFQDRLRFVATLVGIVFSVVLVMVQVGLYLVCGRMFTTMIDHAAPNADVLTPAQFRDRSRSFWLFGTGAGAALFAGALLGVIVGTVIVAQTLYSSTKGHLYEFATLRAIGCSNRYIYRVIIWQALLNAVIGFALATAIGYVVVQATAKSALPIVITPPLIGGLFALTIVIGVGSAVTAIIRVVRIDPVMVMSR